MSHKRKKMAGILIVATLVILTAIAVLGIRLVNKEDSEHAQIEEKKIKQEFSENQTDRIESDFAEEISDVNPDVTPVLTVTPVEVVLTEEERYVLQAEEMIEGMTLQEKICQMFIIRPEMITNVSAVQMAGSATQQALAQWPVGGFIYDKKNMQSKEQVQNMLTNVQNYSKIPLILTCDEEGGRVNRLMDTVGTTWVGPMLSYKEQGIETAADNAKTIAMDMVSCGFNLDLAPVADVWSNPANTVIGDRAYSDDFVQAAELVAAAVDGFHEGGVATTLKHFPGHGDTSADSHYGAVYVYTTLDELREKELLPFQAGIDAGTDAVMMGHLIVSDIDNDPAPFSYQIVTELLREEMGFEGVVMTDALEMGAMTEHYGNGEMVLKAVNAGVDMLLCPLSLEQAVAALEEAVETGELPEERIDESVKRILLLKLQNGFFETQ